MKRAALAAVAVVVCVCTFLGASNGTMSPPSKQTKLLFLYYGDPTAPGYEEEKASWQTFKADNPDIDLQMETLYGRNYHLKLTAYVASGVLPDVMYIWPQARDSSTVLQRNRLVKDLSHVLSAAFLSHFVAPALDVNQQASKMLAELPASVVYTSVMYANKKLLAERRLPLPSSYDDLRRLAAALLGSGVQTVALPDGDKWVAQSCLFSTIVGRLLGDAWVDEVMTGAARFADARFVDALSFYANLFTDGVVQRQNMRLAYGEGISLLAGEKAAFLVDGDWRHSAYNDGSIPSARQSADYALLAFPPVPGEINPGVVSTFAGPGLGIAANFPAGSEKELAAVRLFEFFYGADFQRMKLETGGLLPSRKDVASSHVAPFTSMMLEYRSNIGSSCYVLDGVLSPNVADEINEGLCAIGLGTETPEEVAARVQAAQDDVLATQISLGK